MSLNETLKYLSEPFSTIPKKKKTLEWSKRFDVGPKLANVYDFR